MERGGLGEQRILLLLSVFVIATCGLIYELIAGTLASYLLGDSVTQFSIVIGAYLFSMGIGSFLSKYFQNNLFAWFVKLEILVGVVGGFTSSILFLAFDRVSGFGFLLYSLLGITGILVGLEIPILMRILKDKLDFSSLVSHVFTFDYIGALLASILFPLVMVPYLGLIRTSFLFGIFNVLVAIIVCVLYKKENTGLRLLQLPAYISLFFLILGFVFSNSIQSFAEQLSYNENIIHSESSHYQRVVITREKNQTRLYLNGNLQFSSNDEYRYHEALVHPGLSRIEHPDKVLILGGGDGLALREVLKYPKVKEVVLVDLDSAVTGLFKKNKILCSLNDSSLFNKKLRLINTDAFTWVKQCKEKFDFVIVDFPDPSNFSVGKLYSVSFYRELKKILNEKALFIVQSTSPLVAPKSFWCVNHTIKSCGMETLPFHVFVPSFGEWGYVMGGAVANNKVYYLPEGLRFYNNDSFVHMKTFPGDMSEVPTEINKLNNQLLVHYFEEEWSKVM